MKLPWNKRKIETGNIEGIITHVFLDMTSRKVRKDHRELRHSPAYIGSFVNQIFETFKANHPGFYKEEYREPLKHLVACFIALEAIDKQ